MAGCHPLALKIVIFKVSIVTTSIQHCTGDLFQCNKNKQAGFQFKTVYKLFWASFIAQLVNHLHAMQESRVRFLGRDDPLEKEMATPSSILVWRIPWTEEPDRLQSMGSQESDTTWRLNHHKLFIYFV